MVQALFDYTTLRLIWWVLLGVLLIGFAVTDDAFPVMTVGPKMPLSKVVVPASLVSPSSGTAGDSVTGHPNICV